MLTDHGSIDATLDGNKFYRWIMYGFDGLSLVGAGGAIKEFRATREALQVSRVGWNEAVAGKLSRPQRWMMTRNLGLVGAKRVEAPMIAAVVKQRLLALVATGVGLAGSASSGVIHDLVVWVVFPPPAN